MIGAAFDAYERMEVAGWACLLERGMRSERRCRTCGQDAVRPAPPGYRLGVIGSGNNIVWGYVLWRIGGLGYQRWAGRE